MKSAIRTIVLAAVAAATSLVSTHPAWAQIYSRNTSATYQLQSSGYITVNALIVGKAGNFTLGGTQTFVNEGTQPVFVYCWVSTAAGSNTTMPYGLASSATIPASAYATLPFYGWYSFAGSTELYVVCRATNPSGAVVSTVGNITAAYVP